MWRPASIFTLLLLCPSLQWSSICECVSVWVCWSSAGGVAGCVSVIFVCLFVIVEVEWGQRGGGGDEELTAAWQRKNTSEGVRRLKGFFFLKLISHFEAPRVAMWIFHLIPVAILLRPFCVSLCISAFNLSHNMDCRWSFGEICLSSSCNSKWKKHPAAGSAKKIMFNCIDPQRNIFLLCLAHAPFGRVDPCQIIESWIFWSRGQSVSPGS